MSEPIRVLGDRWAEERPERSLKTQGWRLWEDAKQRKMFVQFSRPPQEATIIALRNNGFHWDETTGIWTRERTLFGFYAGRRILIELEGEF